MREATESVVIEQLKQAFDQFNESSGRLQVRYDELQEEVKDLRSELQLKEDEIKRAEKLATLGETAAALAHEVRNPLGAMRLFMSLLRDDVQDRPESLQIVNHVEKSISDLDHVVSNILHFAKSQPLVLQPLNIHSLISETCEFFERSKHPDQTFSIRTKLQGSPFIRGSEHSLRQVLRNLIQNALESTRHCGDVEIATSDVDNKSLLLTIADSGPGIPDELLATIFEPFVTGRTEGTGLGLAVVHQIVAEHNATITVKNENGARFYIEFPRES